jgi:hypothetical protein
LVAQPTIKLAARAIIDTLTNLFMFIFLISKLLLQKKRIAN